MPSDFLQIEHAHPQMNLRTLLVNLGSAFEEKLFKRKQVRNIYSTLMGYLQDGRLPLTVEQPERLCMRKLIQKYIIGQMNSEEFYQVIRK